MELIINREVAGSTVVIHFKGILDISTVHLIDPYLDDMENVEIVLFNFNRLEFIDSTGMGLIINTIYLSQEKNFQLKLEGINEEIGEMFETVGLFQILEVIQKEITDVPR
ncbi:STAS domain-containing protein [Mesobacillus harenae]|uniref:STAS domain-containing protein n=1 Tax=Mesobacillus harenae TaxID=2213203 RepID=UPI001580FAAB|nr:STAS domain-containing protein [Mesobacillus harenae]